MQKLTVWVISFVLFGMLGTLAVVLESVHNQGFPQALSPAASMNLDTANSTKSDQAIFKELAAISDRDDLGIIRVAPDLTGDQGGIVYIKVDSSVDLPRTVPLFDEGAAQVRNASALTNSYADGPFLLLGSGSQEGLRQWAAQSGLGIDVVPNSPWTTLDGIRRDRAFLVAIAAAVALLIGLVVFWLSVRARSRALRILAGAAPMRIQFEDLVAFMVPVAGAAAVWGVVSVVYVRVAHGAEFVAHAVQTVVLVFALVLVVTFAVALLLARRTMPTTDLIARREPAVGALTGPAAAVRLITFSLVIITIAPAAAAIFSSREAAQQLDQWKSLSTYVSVGMRSDLSEDRFQRTKGGFGQVVKDLERQRRVAMSYAWTAPEVAEQGGTAGSYDGVALVNTQWLSLVCQSEMQGSTPVDPRGNPTNAQDWLAPSMELWLRKKVPTSSVLDAVSWRQLNSPEGIAFARAGNGDFTFLRRPLLIVVDDLYGTWKDDFLGSLMSSSNIVFDGLDSTSQAVRQAGIIRQVNVRYAAEDGVLRAKLADYFAGLRVVSVLTLIIALILAGAVCAVISALRRGRHDFPLRLSGSSWLSVVWRRVTTDALAAAIVSAIAILMRPQGVAVIAATYVLAMTVLLGFHVVAARWVFRERSLRRVI